jgi:hypothetical protein
MESASTLHPPPPQPKRGYSVLLHVVQDKARSHYMQIWILLRTNGMVEVVRLSSPDRCCPTYMHMITTTYIIHVHIGPAFCLVDMRILHQQSTKWRALLAYVLHPPCASLHPKLEELMTRNSMPPTHRQINEQPPDRIDSSMGSKLHSLVKVCATLTERILRAACCATHC